jgi:hypothetical protein
MERNRSSMRPIADLAGRSALWICRAAPTAEYELRDGDAVLATLRSRKACGSLASARTEGGHWTFKHVGFFTSRITVRAAEREAETAVYTPKSGRAGVLAVAQGATYRWRMVDATTRQWTGPLEEQDWLVRFTFPGTSPRDGSSVEVAPGAAALADLPLLVLLGWYLSVLLATDLTMVAILAGVVAASS